MSARRRLSVSKQRIRAVAQEIGATAVEVRPGGAVVFYLTDAPAKRLTPGQESAPDLYAPRKPDAP